MFVRDHHERWDGTGYPRGISGDQITKQGRLISICDAFDTMTIERRSYKEQTLTYEQAFDELRKCSNEQFDGKMVDFFIRVVKSMKLLPIKEWYNQPNVMKEMFIH
jgi:HD-GYP domain-containing protein (c-di-GMP phosphodiesterase class II)